MFVYLYVLTIKYSIFLKALALLTNSKAFVSLVSHVSMCLYVFCVNICTDIVIGGVFFIIHLSFITCI